MAGQIRVEVDGVGTLEFPDGTDRGVIDRVVKREVASRRGLPPDAEPETGPGGVATGLRVVPAVAGGFFGPLIGAAGAGLGELAAQTYEYATGADDDFNLPQVGLQAGLGAIPGTKLLQAVRGAKGVLGRLGANAALGATIAGPAQVLTEQVEEQGAAGLNPMADPSRLGERLARGATLGAAFGAGASGVGEAAGAVLRRRSAQNTLTGNVAPRGGRPDSTAGSSAAGAPAARGAVTSAGASAAPSASPGGAPAASMHSPRRRELLQASNWQDAKVDSARINDIRARADTGEALTRPTTAGPRVVEGLTRRQGPMAADVADATLPRDLAGATPRFNIGATSYEPQFASDVDRAAYILAQETPSQRDADYLAFVQQQTGLDEAGARAFGRRVRLDVRRRVEGRDPGAVRIPGLWPAQRAMGAAPAALDQLPGVRGGLLTPEQAGFLKLLSDDLGEWSFQRGGTSLAQRRDAFERWRPGDPDYEKYGFGLNSGHAAGTPTLKTFQALGVDASRPQIAAAIDRLLQGKPGGGAIDDAALRYVEVLRDAFDPHTSQFDWARVSPATLERIGIKRRDLHAPRQPTEMVFEGQGPETREYFAPALRDEADGPIPDLPRIIEGLRLRRPSEEIRQPQPIRDPLAGVEPLLQRMPEELRPAMRQVLADNQGFADQRRQSMPFGVIDRLARQLAVDASQVLPKGSALNAESLRAYANAAATTQQKIQTLADKVNASQATDADLVALSAARAEHTVVLSSLMGARAEAGRALSSFRMFSKVLQSGDSNLIRAALKAPGARSELNDLAAQLATVGDDPLARYQFLQRQATPTLTEKFRGYFYANILSGLKTHERNFLGNAFNSITNLATVPVAGALDAVRSRATGQPRTVFAGELPAQVMGGLIGTHRGLRDFVFTLRNGVSPRNLTGTLDKATSTGAFDRPRVELGGGGANPFNWPGRMLDATDTFFRSIARNQEWYGMAFAQAKREGLNGQRLVERIAAIKVEDSPLARQLDEQADSFSTRAVFQEQPGKVAAALQNFARQVPAMTFVIPFIKTPANILRQGAEFSPLGALMAPARHGGRAGTQAQARVAMGTMMLAPLAMLAASGRLSGSGPQDRAERTGLMESGWRPNSIKVPLSSELAQQLAAKVGGIAPAADGEYWISYSLFQPVSVPASVIANAFESWQAQDGKNPPSLTTLGVTIGRTARSILDQSYLSGLFDVLEAVDNPDQFFSRWMARTAHSLTPFAGAQRTVQQALDPTVRQPQGFTESFQVSVPGRSDNIPARVDRFGEHITRPGNALARAADPFNISPASGDPVAVELQRLGVDFNPPSARIELQSGRQVSRDEEQQVKQARGRAVRQQLGMLLANPSYMRLDDDRKRRAVLRAIDRARSVTTRRLKGALR